MSAMLRALVLAGLVLAPLGGHAGAVERFNTFLRTTHSASATFEQAVYDRNRNLVQEASGRFMFLRPGRFRWIYEKPTEQLIVGDGERVWIHDPDLNQVTVRRLSKALGSTPAALLAGAGDIDSAFELSEAGEREGLEWLEARPRDREAGFERILLGMGAAGVAAMELTDHFGQTTVLRFKDMVPNPKLDAADFRFEPPAGADVLGER
jgi:outer membrane lipoprotein carrier protein